VPSQRWPSEILGPTGTGWFAAKMNPIRKGAPVVHKQIVIPLILLAMSATSQLAWAALGGMLDSVEADQSRMHATRRIADRNGYQVHEMVLSGGTVVREFATPSGAVFGVAWQGPFKPDLNQLLGEYFARLVTAGQSPHGDHRMLKVRDADLVIDSGGKMRAFAGRAYLPALVPGSVSVDDIR